MSANLPSIFNMNNLSSGISALRYVPGTSKTTTSLHSCVSIIRTVNRSSKDRVGNDEYSLGV